MRSFRFEARWLDAEGAFLTGQGAGAIAVRRTPRQALVVEERGQWEPRPGHSVGFHGTYRWNTGPAHLTVERPGRGEDNPTPHLDLMRRSDGWWMPEEPFRCGDEEYSARLRLEASQIVLRWVAKGPTQVYTLLVTYE